MIEYAVFRKDGRGYGRPLEGRTFTSAEAAARYMQTFLHWADWLEVHEREVGNWTISV